MKRFLVLIIVSSQLFHGNMIVKSPLAHATPPDNIMGVFVGRTPCQEIGKQLSMNVPGDCYKLKWKFTFYQDATGKPTTYKLARTMSRSEDLLGKWMITEGIPSDPRAIVYRLVPDKETPEILLLKGDDNVLFFLDNQRQPLTGNNEFSYTLNRKMD